MFFYKKKKKKNKNKSFSLGKKNVISYAQMRMINDRILSKRRLIIYAESEE
jgi:hypothetical protein